MLLFRVFAATPLRVTQSACNIRMLSMQAGTITTLEGTSRFEEVIKKSRFIGLAAPVTSAAEALEFVKANSDLKARHNCFAWRLADGTMRTNGDGEPGGTAGPPILAAIDGAGLSNVAVLVSRYRLGEGAKLGTGGLVRAYGGTAAQTLAAASVVQVEPRVAVTVRYDLSDTGPVFSTLGSYGPRPIDDPDGAAASAADGIAAESACLTFELHPDTLEQVAAALTQATSGRAVVVKGAADGGEDDDSEAAEEEEEDEVTAEEAAEEAADEGESDEATNPQTDRAREADARAASAGKRAGDAAARSGGRKRRNQSQCQGRSNGSDGGERQRGRAEAPAAGGDAGATRNGLESGSGSAAAMPSSVAARPSACMQCGSVSPMLFQDESDQGWYCTVCWKAYLDALDAAGG